MFYCNILFLQALATEVTSAFSQRLSPLNITVKELTGDMQLSKNELQETHRSMLICFFLVYYIIFVAALFVLAYQHER